MAGIGVAFVLLLAESRLALGGAALLCLVSFLDDWRGLPIVLRFIAHFAIAAAFIFLALPALHPVSTTAIVLAIVWMTNLYNFMDGSDGLAGGMTVFGFAALALATYLSGELILTSMAASVAAAAAAFLWFNFHPARIFMGDAGSVPLGFLAAALAVLGWDRGAWPVWFPVLVFSPFIVDATVTLFRRALRGEKVWRAHKEHYYQRLVRMGFGHRNTALMEYVLMGSVAGTALLAREANQAVQLLTLAVWFGVYAAIMAIIDRRWRAHLLSHPNA
jgi:UDP-N-acetylmuramyl pentapeptide phosphotransferase/UDP-N-acetylglucosamine-1-phosphate transferase